MLRNLHFPPIMRPSISRRWTYPRSVRGFIRRIPAASSSVSSFSPIGSRGFHSPGLSRLVMAGVDIRTVQELLGHKTISMTVRYSHLAHSTSYPRWSDWTASPQNRPTPLPTPDHFSLR